MLYELENNMIIEAVTTRLLNESEIRASDLYHVVIESNDTIKLHRVKHNKTSGAYTLRDNTPLTLSEDAANGTQRLSSYEFKCFVTPILHPDDKKVRRNHVPKNERLAELFKDITADDIAAFLKERTSGKAD